MTWKRTLLVLLAFCALAVVWTWPLVLKLDTSLGLDPRFGLFEHSGSYAGAWGLWWSGQALGRGVDPLWCDLVFHPYGTSLRHYEHHLLLGLLSQPLQAMGGVVFALNSLMLLMFVGAAAATYRLAREVGACTWGSLLAGFLWAFSPWFVQHSLEEPSLFPNPWVPLGLLFLSRWMSPRSSFSARRRAAIGLGLMFAACWMTSSISLMWLSVLSVGWILVAPQRADEEAARRSQLLRQPFAIALAVLFGVALSYPIMGSLPLSSSAEWFDSSVDQASNSTGSIVQGDDPQEFHSPHPLDLLVPPGLHPFFYRNPSMRFGAALPREWRRATERNATDLESPEVESTDPKSTDTSRSVQSSNLLASVGKRPIQGSTGEVELQSEVTAGVGLPPTVHTHRAGLYIGVSTLSLAFLVLARSGLRRLLLLTLWCGAWVLLPGGLAWLSRLGGLRALGGSRMDDTSLLFPALALPLVLAAACGASLLRRRRGGVWGLAYFSLLALVEFWVIGWPLVDVRPPAAVQAIAERTEAGEDSAVLVLPLLKGADPTMLWQTQHQRPVLYSSVGAEPKQLFTALRARSSDLFGLMQGSSSVDPMGLEFDLGSLAVGHILVRAEFVPDYPEVRDLLDSMVRWERVEQANGAHGLDYWRRSLPVER